MSGTPVDCAAEAIVPRKLPLIEHAVLGSRCNAKGWSIFHAASLFCPRMQTLSKRATPTTLWVMTSVSWQARTEAAALQQECMALRHQARSRRPAAPAVAAQQKGTPPPSPDPINKWLARSISKAGSPIASWRRNGSRPLPTA